MKILNNETIKKVMFNEISFGLALISASFWVFNYLNSPINKMQTDIALIQQNIERIAHEHETYSKDAHERDLVIIEIGKSIAEIKVLLKGKLSD